MWRVGCGLSRGPCAAAVARCSHNIASPAFPLFVRRSTSTTNLGNVAVRSSSPNRLGGATSPSPSPTPNPRRFLCFSDLHFRAPALSRAVEVLRRVRGLASGCMSPEGGQAAPNLATAGSEVVFLGDFFHHRNVVMVPHIDILMREFQLWYEQGVRAVFIPGNHDQVSLDGKVHALSLLSAFPNIRVATEPLLDREDRVAFLPWREEAESQTRLFKMLREEQEKCDQRPWTIFAHAEVGGSVSNGGHLVKGRVNRTDIEAVSRACYLGHFHKRQQIGDRIWYLGSPFQQNFGEAGQPKGAAVISLDRVEPQFVDWDDMPRHHIINYTPDDLQGFSSRASHVRSDDYVKVLVSSAHVGSSQLAEWLSGLSGAHVQLAVDPTLPEVAETAVEFPRGAMTEQLSGSLLNDILHRYVAKHTTSGSDEERREILRHGLELLSLVPDSQRQIVPLGKVVDITSVSVSGFCGIANELKLEFGRDQTMTLLRGEMGIGKTSLFDGLSWCLFGRTTPRKAGTDGASLRADEVVNDYCTEAIVTVELLVDGNPITIKRLKKRKAGAKVLITEGGTNNFGLQNRISSEDSQDLIHSIVGMDYSLFRTCVFLGQGEVTNFVTDADKKRKEMLATLFGLNACTHAMKIARDNRRRNEESVYKLEKDMVALDSALHTWTALNPSEDERQWHETTNDKLTKLKIAISAEEAKMQHVLATRRSQAQAASTDDPSDPGRGQLEEEVISLNKQLRKMSESSLISSLKVKLGETQTNQWQAGKLSQDLFNRINTLEHAADKSCYTCGQPLTPKNSDRVLGQLKTQLESANTEERQLEQQVAALKSQLADMHKQQQTDIGQLELRLKEAQKKLAALRQQQEQEQKISMQLAQLKARVAELETATNPHLEKRAQQEREIARLTREKSQKEGELNSARSELKRNAFWEDGFGHKGMHVTVLEEVLPQLQTYANRYLSRLLKGRVHCRLEMEDEKLLLRFFEYDITAQQTRERSFNQLSRGQQRCVELAFSPFALSELVFARTGLRTPFLIVDELTTHMDAETKPVVCDLLRELGREKIVVVDHDPTVQGQFDAVLDIAKRDGTLTVARCS